MTILNIVLIFFKTFVSLWKSNISRHAFSTAALTMLDRFLFEMFVISSNVLLIYSSFNILVISDNQSP